MDRKPEDSSEKKGLIFNIQKFSIHDGPGIRDLIFLKGCPLRCQWCSNPESQKDTPEVAFNQSRCIGLDQCDRCASICPNHALRVGAEGKIEIDRTLCIGCGRCADACPAKAIKLYGQPMTVDEVISVAEEDSAFHSRSGGGITVSGGEPLVQAEFVQHLLKKSRKHGLDTAIETSGYGSWPGLERVCRYANLIFYDLKCLDSKKHKKFTGVSNRLILENLKRLLVAFPAKPIVIRTTIVRGFNDTVEDIQAIADFLRILKGRKKHELLPYHGYGESKYDQLGREYAFRGLQAPGTEKMESLRKIAECIPAPEKVPEKGERTKMKGAGK